MPDRNGPLQLVPPGFLSLLGLKNQGHMPADLGEVVAPTLDMLGFYLRTNAQFDPVTHGVSVGPTGSQVEAEFSPNQILVPDGEVWYVHEYSVSVRVPAGAGNFAGPVSAVMRYNQSGTIQFGLLSQNPITVTATAGAPAEGIIGAQGFWVPPGASLGFWCSQLNATASTVDFRGMLRATKLKL